MSLVVIDRASLGFGKKTLFRDLDVRIGVGDRIGLVGPNGSGKTSLMRLLAGEQTPDSGSIRPRRALRTGYLPQELHLDEERSLLDFVVGSVPGRDGLDAAVSATEAELVRLEGQPDEGETELMEQAQLLADLHERLAHFDLYYSEHEALRILAGLGFQPRDHTRPLAEFSGGWKMRALLTTLLFQRPDLLLLDEPTNHLDMPSVAWFGGFLRRYTGAFVLICHDREFLNEQIDRVVAFESEGVRQYRGNHDQYTRQRAEEEIVLENKARNVQRERDKAEQFINRFRAQANKAKAVQSRIKAVARMDEVQTFRRREVMSFSFPACERTGDSVLRVSELGKSYGDLSVFAGVDLTVRRGEKIGIIGVNGAGKTTLLKIMAREIEATRGSIDRGSKVDVGYYAQHHTEALEPDATAYEEVARRDGLAGQTRVRKILGAFLFSGDDVDKKVRVLSGGERSRVALARLLIRPGNLLLMDEPTNHLDLESSESLAESLAGYDGTLIFVSHNRSFVRRLATRIWNVADGAVETYPGTLDEYLESSRQRRDLDGPPADEDRADEAPATAEPAASVTPSRPRTREQGKAQKRRDAQRRAKYRRAVGGVEKKVDELERQATELEAKQKRRNAELADPACYEDNQKRAEILRAYQKAATQLEELNARWEVALGELETAKANFTE